MGDGRNILRVFLFKHKVTEGDFERGQYNKEDMVQVGAVQTELDVEIAQHFFGQGKAPGICTGHKCPVCEDVAVLEASDRTADRERARQLSAGRRWLLNAVDMQHPERGVLKVELPKTVYQEIQKVILDDEFGEVVCGPDGRDFIVDRDPDAPANKMYSVLLRDAARCVKLPKALKGKDLMADGDYWPGHGLNDYKPMFERHVVEEEPEVVEEEPEVVEEKEPAPKPKPKPGKKKVSGESEAGGLVGKMVRYLDEEDLSEVTVDDGHGKLVIQDKAGDLFEVAREECTVVDDTAGEAPPEDDIPSDIQDSEPEAEVEEKHPLIGKMVSFKDGSDKRTGMAIEESTENPGDLVVSCKDAGGEEELFSVPATMLKEVKVKAKTKTKQ